jgi:nucleoside-diphosphate-sugar epimerase
LGREIRHGDSGPDNPVTRILLTGATGFIGRSVARRLAGEGYAVVALHGSRSPPFDDPNIEWVECDLLDRPPDLAALGPTHCIHMAWYTNHADYLIHPVNRNWVNASLRLAEVFVAAGGTRFVGLGTCLEYDVADAAGACTEGETPLRPETFYARCKLELSESLARTCADFAWARVFFVYGPGDRAGRLVPGLVERLKRGEPAVPTYGGLRRDYIHVDDLAWQLIRIALEETQGPINTGTGTAPTLSEIFSAGANAIGRPELACANGEIGGQPLRIQADMARFRAEIGEPAARSIAEGLKGLLA